MTFSEKVTLPPEFTSIGAIGEPLLESDRFETIRSDYEKSERSYCDGVVAANEVARLIRRSIKLSLRKQREPGFSPEWLEAHHATNCHGHTLIASECLEVVGIPHRIGVTNDHSFLLMEDPDSGRVDMIDTPVGRLCAEITPALGGVALQEHSREQGGVNRVWGNLLLRNGKFRNEPDILSKARWASFATGNGAELTFLDNDNPNNHLILRTFVPQVGQEVVLAYDSFTRAMQRPDIHEAYNWIQCLDGKYPDIDRRNKLRSPTKLVKDLGAAALADEALSVINIIENSVKPFSKDLFLMLWPIDVRCNLGATIKSAELIQQSLEAYDAVKSQREEDQLSTSGVECRIKKANKHLHRVTRQ